MENIRDGSWATMVTPFTDRGDIDYKAVESLAEWYIDKGADGIFAVCQSSEMFWLSFEERHELAKFILDAVGAKIEVIVCGNVEEDMAAQIKEARAFAELEPKAVVFVSNRLECGMGFMSAVDKILRKMPDDVPLGIYECPHPSKRLLTDDECRHLVQTGRFVFLKDTSCDVATMARRAAIVSGSAFKLYNANAATLYETLRFGYSGYCGVMANYHPDLYAWLCKNFADERAARLEKYLGMMSVIECRQYPHSAKRYLKLFEGLDMNELCRSQNGPLASSIDCELRDVYEISQEMRKYIKEVLV